MGKSDSMIDQSPLTSARGRELSRQTCGVAVPDAAAAHSAHPLFARFAVSKEWRTKDTGAG